MATILEALAVAVQHHQAGRLEAAEQIYRQILAVEPNQPDALHLLGVIAHQVGRSDVAIEYIQRAIRFKGTDSAFHSNLGAAFQAQGKLDEAVACYHRALELKPDHAQAHVNLGNAFQAQGKSDQAALCYRRALEFRPDYAEAHSNLGTALKDLGNLSEAERCYRRALELKPDLARAHYNLGTAFQEQGKPDEAVACYRRALELQPNLAEANINLGAIYQDHGHLDEAVACYRRAQELQPHLAKAHYNLGTALKDRGDLDEAIAGYRRALELQPDYAEAHDNLLFALLFCSDCDPKTIYEEHCRWNQQFAKPLAELIQLHSNERSPGRRLRIGYVSPDFRTHVVGLFLLPLLEAHDHERYEIYCYASVRDPDAVTDRCRAQADVWRNVISFSDEQLADAIRQDQIDILVDLAMHTANNRLLVFARKPAPVQVTYLAYAGTTGLSTMDYRLTDPYLDPPDQDDSIYREASIRLPETYWCYRPLVDTPPVNALPALSAAHVTFGCLNNFAKVTAPTLNAWISLLQAMPEARLLLHASPGQHRDRVRSVFDQQGISPQRVAFADRVPMAEYLQLYHRIDVALDPLPYGGGTTTCDALWMGVPVVTLAGQTAVGRGGLSILSNVGLADLVAYDSEQYVRIALELAGDLPRLSKLRATLRERMQSSPPDGRPAFCTQRRSRLPRNVAALV